MSANAEPGPAHYDVAVIGGAYSGAAAALLIKRALPAARVLIVERQACFNRKVGEATVEISALFLYRVLGLYDHLSREHLPKHGLRYWFSDGQQRSLAEMTEVGGHSVPGLPSFQLDRAVLDEHLLALAAAEGCTVARPARVLEVSPDWPRSRLRYAQAGGEHTVTARWVLDASGRQAFLARRLKLHEHEPSHPTAAYWARWEGVADLDGRAMAGDGLHRPRLPAITASRRLATNHFCGYGWWCWVIPLAGGQTSIGLVYDKTLFELPDGASPRERYRRFVTASPGLAELLAGARMDEGDFHGLGHLPYRTRRYMDPGWALLGDAAAFMDPYYSPGLDHASFSVYASARLIEDDLAGRLDEAALLRAIDTHNGRFLRSYRRWLSALYLGKYRLMGDAELLRCAFLIDTALYHLGVVGPLYRRPGAAFGVPVFGLELPQAHLAYGLLRFFNRRLTRLAELRRASGRYGRRNLGRRYLSRGFDGLRPLSWLALAQGLRAWLGLELEQALLRLRPRPPARPQPTVQEP